MVKHLVLISKFLLIVRMTVYRTGVGYVKTLGITGTGNEIPKSPLDFILSVVCSYTMESQNTSFIEKKAPV